VRGAPQRTCVGCRKVRPKSALLRLVRDMNGQVKVNGEGGASGRGAYACPTVDCLTKALHAGRLAHAFKRASKPPQESAAAILASWQRR
jgi:predicted RNA-binding protein YlxR (DUF448 family)